MSLLNWRPFGKAKAREEIAEKYDVVRACPQLKHQFFKCKKYFCIQSSSQRCPYRIRWNEKSGRLWESGEHNHEPIEKRWNFVAKFQAMNANSMNALRRQYMVRKDSENVHKMKFRCVLAMQKSDRTKKQRSGTTCKEAAQEKNVPKDNEQAEVEKEPFCSYSMMWNSKTGNLFESGQHTNHEMPKRIKLKNEWHLLESESGKDISIEAILARFSVKVSGKMTGHYWFKCNRCDGRECSYQLRRKDGQIFWNNEPQCQQQQTGEEKAEKEKVITPHTVPAAVEETEMGLGTLEGSEPHKQPIDQIGQKTKSSALMPAADIQLVEEIRDYKCHLPPMKLEPLDDGERGSSNNNNFLSSVTIGEGEEVEKSSSLTRRPTDIEWRVKKEEPNDEESEGIMAQSGQPKPQPNTSKVMIEPIKMLLRERKRRKNQYYAGPVGKIKKAKAKK